MRHLPIEPETLLSQIRHVKPSWLQRAGAEAEVNRSAGRAASERRLWSEIKAIFTEHQRNKCAYCERRLGSAGVEWDVEHFRPQKRVDAWRRPSQPTLQTGAADERGYFMLAFEPRNYLASCKTCNSSHKRNFFPIAGRARVIEAMSVTETRAEQAYLLNPLDPQDTPPETMIGFHGITPRPLSGAPPQRARALVTIEILKLGTRPDLDLERAEKIRDMWFALMQRDDPSSPHSVVAREAVDAMTAKGSPMSSCASSFRDLYEHNQKEAQLIGVLATRFVNSHSR